MVTPAKDLVHALDPALFAREALAFQPDAWQERVLRWTGKRIILNCHRQSGKSTIAAILALHKVLYYPDSLVLLVSPSLRQSSELFRKTGVFLDLLEEAPKLEEDNKLSLTLKNGSRIVSLPSQEGTVRGFSGVDLLIEDEAARVPDDLYKAIRPMLAVSNGRLILMSTPFGKRGHFHSEWEQGGNWERFMVKATDCPRITAEFLEEEKASMGEAWYLQEYQCEFSDTLDQVFSYEVVMAALDDSIQPLFGESL